MAGVSASAADLDGTAPGRQGIRSLETGIRLFQEVHRLQRPATLTEISGLMRMHPSKVHRYCASLILTGLLQQTGRGLYAIGPFGFRLSSPSAEREHAKTLAIDLLPRIVQDTGETVFVSAWGETGPAILAVKDAPRPISVRPTTTGDLPLLNSATGRVFAAFLDPARLDALIAQEFAALRRADKLSAAAMDDARAKFARHLGDVRRRGLARTTGERYPGLVSFAAPVFDHGGHVVLAFTSFGLSQTFPSKWNAPVPQALLRWANSLTVRLGGRRPSDT
jgi:DNA-binding IclR family transcriptional regulator